jgi:hypothetical protein
MGTYRMRFLWPDEIDADRANYQKLLERWGSDEAIDDMEHAFGSLFWQMAERVRCVVTLDARTQQAAFEEAAARWQRHPLAAPSRAILYCPVYSGARSSTSESWRIT